jgi:hypothetical protein
MPSERQSRCEENRKKAQQPSKSRINRFQEVRCTHSGLGARAFLAPECSGRGRCSGGACINVQCEHAIRSERGNHVVRSRWGQSGDWVDKCQVVLSSDLFAFSGRSRRLNDGRLGLSSET